MRAHFPVKRAPMFLFPATPTRLQLFLEPSPRGASCAFLRRFSVGREKAQSAQTMPLNSKPGKFGEVTAPTTTATSAQLVVNSATCFETPGGCSLSDKV
ncbi:MAG: hypothetical protein ACKOTE_15660, partial [Opitutaceae bacterium]